MAENPIAQVWVQVMPETSKIASGIRDALRGADKDVIEAARRWKGDIERELKDVETTVKADTAEAKAELDKLRAEEERKPIRQRVEVDTGGLGGALKLNASLVGIGLLPAAATAITDVAGAVQQLAGAGLILPGVMAGLASSMGVAALATQGMGAALKDLDKASDGTKASVDAANAALAKLPASTADAVETIYGLKGTFEDLQKIASANLFQGFSTGLKTLVGNDLPAVTRGIDGISHSLNQNLLQAMTSLGSGSSQGFLSRIFGNTADAQGKLTAAIDPVIHAFGTLAAAGSDSLPRLATAVGDVADRFDRFITTADGDGKLQKWIGDGLTGFKDLGDIVLNIGKSFTALTEAAGGGTGLLPMLEELTQRMSTFLNSSAGQQELVNFFHQGGQELGQLRDIAAQVGPILGGIFQEGISAANNWLPIIREVLGDINAIPGGAQGVVGAFVAWKTIQGPVALFNSLNNLSGMLGGMGGKATAAGNAMDGALRLAGPIAAAFALQSAYDGVLNKINQITGSHIATDINNRIGPDAGKWWIDEFNGNHPTQARTDAQSKLDAARKAAEAKGAPPPPAPAASTGTPYDPFAVLGLPPPGPAPTYAPGFVGPVPAGANRPVLALPPPPSSVVVPPVSTYSAPVITQPSKAAGSSAPAATAGQTGVPLTQNPDGTWTSTNPAWAHLIQRESSGVNQVQKIQDVNSGGNEAEGLFQITPATWRANGGTEFAPNALSASPQDQSIVAARILQKNPSGSDWGAGLAGRENASQLMAGLSPASASSSASPASAMYPGMKVGSTKDSPLYVMPAKDGAFGGPAGQLGQNVGDDIWQEIGLPGMTNPKDFGITKFLSGFLNGALGINLDGNSGGGASGGAGSGSLIPGGGGGGIGGLLGLVQNFMPGAPATSGMPGMPQSNSPNILSAVQFKPPGGPGSPGPGNVIDNGIHLEGASFGDSHQVLSSQISEMNASKNRYGPLTQNFAT